MGDVKQELNIWDSRFGRLGKDKTKLPANRLFDEGFSDPSYNVFLLEMCDQGQLLIEACDWQID